MKRQPIDDETEDVKAPGLLQTGGNWLSRPGRAGGSTRCVTMSCLSTRILFKDVVAQLNFTNLGKFD